MFLRGLLGRDVFLNSLFRVGFTRGLFFVVFVVTLLVLVLRCCSGVTLLVLVLRCCSGVTFLFRLLLLCSVNLN